MITRLLTFLLVRHLPLADNIIVLDASGRISDQGSFECLRAKDGFVSKVIDHPDLLEGPANPEGDESAKKPLLKVLQGLTANDITERTRRIGDFGVYKYYYASVGIKLTSIIMAMSVVYMIFGNFPC